MFRHTALVALLSLLAMTAAMAAPAEESPYHFTRGFPADETTTKQAQDATALRRAIEAYKFFYPTVATEAVIQQFEPHGAIPNKVGIIMPQDPGTAVLGRQPGYPLRDRRVRPEGHRADGHRGARRAVTWG